MRTFAQKRIELTAHRKYDFILEFCKLIAQIITSCNEHAATCVQFEQ